MTNDELIDEISLRTGIPKPAIIYQFQHYAGSIKLSLRRGGAVKLMWFGIFYVGLGSRRQSYNRHTHTFFTPPHKKRARFRAHLRLKEVINGIRPP